WQPCELGTRLFRNRFEEHLYFPARRKEDEGIFRTARANANGRSQCGYWRVGRVRGERTVRGDPQFICFGVRSGSRQFSIESARTWRSLRWRRNCTQDPEKNAGWHIYDG